MVSAALFLRMRRSLMLIQNMCLRTTITRRRNSRPFSFFTAN